MGKICFSFSISKKTVFLLWMYKRMDSSVKVKILLTTISSFIGSSSDNWSSVSEGKLFFKEAFSFFLSDPFICVFDFTRKGFVKIVMIWK